MSVLATKHLWRVLAISAALLFTYAIVLSKLAYTWWNDENYSHGLLIPFIIAYILWTQRERLVREPTKPSTLWGGLVGWRCRLTCLDGSLGRNCRRRVVHAKSLAGSDARGNSYLLLGFSPGAAFARSSEPAGACHSNSRDHIQQSRVPIAAFCFSLCSVVHELV